jgi:hypothetical protein
MEDIVLRAELDDSTYLYISPISRETYEEHIHDDNLGGAYGYFVLRSRRTGTQRLEVLAKVPTLEAAAELFDMILGRRRALAR